VTARRIAGWLAPALALPLLAAGVISLSGVRLEAGQSRAKPASAAPDRRVVDAVKKRDREAVRALLKQRADVNTPLPDGATALHWAVHDDDLETVDLLIRGGANVNAANDLGVTPLALAAVNRNAAMVQALLTAGANPNAVLKSGESVLMTAARTGNAVAAVKALLANGANVNATDPLHGQTALMWAAAQDHAEIVQVLIENGADIHARSTVRHRRIQVGGRVTDHRADTTAYTDLGGYTPLLFAARQGSINSARALLAAGATIDDPAPDGTSALVVAAHSGQAALAAFLLENGADSDASGAGYTALHAAVLRGDLPLVKTLLARGANPNAELTKGTPVRYVSHDYAFNVSMIGATPFWLAAKYGEVEMMKVLAAAGADPLRPIKDSTTPLMATIGNPGGALGISDRRERFLTPTELAAKPADEDERITLEAAKAAIEAGADVNASTNSGETALHSAASRGFVALVQLLTDKGANVNATNRSGDTPLHNAATRGSVAIVQWLAEHGAHLEAKNKNGMTPLAATMAPERGGGGGSNVAAGDARKATAELLRKLGAKE
jgi:ankyrin repeat protein